MQILATVNDLLAAQGMLLKADTAVDATFIAAPISTKNKDKKRDPENKPIEALIEKVWKIKASILAKVEHPFRVIKRQFGYAKVRYRGSRRTRCSSRRCLRYRTSGWCATNWWRRKGMRAPENRVWAGKAVQATRDGSRTMRRPEQNGGNCAV